jgi:GTPase KRas protein
VKHAKIDSNYVHIEIQDTAGQEEYKTLKDQYMRTAEGFMIVFSIVDQATYEEMKELHEQILRVKDCNSYPIVLCGNKADLENDRQVSQQEVTLYAKQHGVTYYETSAKQRKNIDESFYQLVRETRKTKLGNSETVTTKKRKYCNVM